MDKERESSTGLIEIPLRDLEVLTKTWPDSWWQAVQEVRQLHPTQKSLQAMLVSGALNDTGWTESQIQDMRFARMCLEMPPDSLEKIAELAPKIE